MAEIKTRTAYDLERKYNLSNLSSVYKAVENTSLGLTKVNNELENFVIQVDKSIDDLQDQLDGNIMTWFYSGEPTNENLPASEWIDDSLKQQHIGDLYYDKDTGYAYRWTLDNETNLYSWFKLTDADITEALAVANSAKDVADSKRRIFTTTPTTPYDVGDIWLKNDEDLYRCSVGRLAEDTYHQADWMLGTKYTDDTAANNVQANLDLLETNVEENYTSTALLASTKNSILGQVEEVKTLTESNDEKIKTLEMDTKTEFEQLSDSFNFKFENMNTQIIEQGDLITENQQTLIKHIQFVDGNIILATDGGQVKLKIENDRISFINNSNIAIGYWTPNSFQLGEYAFIPRANGSLDFKKVV